MKSVAGGEGSHHFVMADGCQAHGGDAAALRAVGLSAELAGGDRRGEIGGDGFGGAGKDAFGGTFGGRSDFVDERFGHVEDVDISGARVGVL